MKNHKGIHWLSDEDYGKARTQMKMGIQPVFNFIKVDDKLPIRYQYGLGVYVDEAI